MRLSRAFSFLSFLALTFVPQARPQQPITAATFSPPLAKLSFDLYHNRIYLPVVVNGRKEFSMVVDTGAAMSGLSQQSAELLLLQPKGHAQLVGNGNAALSISFAKDVNLQIGEATLAEKSVAIVPFHDMEASEGRPIAGVLGVNLFRRYVVVVDYVAKTLALYEPEHFVHQGTGEVIPLEFGKGAIFHARVSVTGGAPITANLAVDSGTYSGLRLYGPFVQKHHLLQPSSPVLNSFGFGIGGDFPEKLGRVQALEIGTLKLTQPGTSFSEAQHGVTASSAYDGTIGGDILRRFTVTFDYSRHQMILDPNADFSAPFHADTSGLILESQGPDMKTVSVRHVLAETPATAAGIREGDTIISVNGTEAQSLGLEGIRALLCQTGAYRLQLRRGQQNLEMTISTNKQLY